MKYRFTTIEKLLSYEIKQKEEEGYDVENIKKSVNEEIEGSWQNLMKFDQEISDKRSQKKLRKIYDKLTGLEKPNKYDEPSSLADIFQKSSPHKPLSSSLNKDELFDKLKGAWEGRCAGCLLGKPVEGWGGQEGKEQIESYLKEANEYPLRNYFPKIDSDDYEIHHASEGALRDNITHMIRDDDIDYPILNLNIIENYGTDFKSEAIADFWLNNLPYMRTYTAERAAYKNFVNGILPPESATKFNPYREWIGAQIRGDMFGWINPAKPKKAAEMAYRDASISHRKNGIYGEMFIASLLSGASVVEGSSAQDINNLIEIGLSVVPQGSRFYQAITETKGWANNDQSWEETFNKVMENYGNYHWIHTINNAAIVVLALIHGQGNFEDSICISVMCGHDTDCNGATVGSIVGIMKGSSNLPGKWINPLNDRVESIVIGDTDNKISDLAQRTFEVSNK